MTRERYIRMTETTRRAVSRLPGGTKALRAPTLLCAAIYCASLLYLMFTGDRRIIRAVIVPAVCFAVVTVLRPLIGKQRPYDRYGVPPVGAYKPGKGKSMPSRHTASAAAIACAIAYVFPHPAVIACMALLSAVIGSLRVLSGQHDISDVLAALALSLVISLVGYRLYFTQISQGISLKKR